jgi:hypothetical protein
VPFSSYCTRCSRPLEVESASGLCLECLRTVNSPQSTSKDQSLPEPVVDPHASTLSGPPKDLNDPVERASVRGTANGKRS